MDTVKDKIVQTSKTILFEEFNADKPDLATLLTNEDPEKDSFQRELEDTLEVYSFKQFLERFAPEVYEVCQRNSEGKPEFIYTTDKEKIKGQYAVKQPITDHAYYKMLSSLYYEKGSSGESNLQFDDEKILKMLTPKQEVEEARDIRKSLQYNLEKYQELEEKGENSSEYAQQFMADREKIVKKYKDSKMGLLPLVIDDAKAKLKLLNEIAPPKDSDEKDTSYVSGMLTFSPEGNLIVEPKNENTEIENITDNSQDEQKLDVNGTITALLEQDYDAAEQNKNDFVKSLVVSVYAPMGDNNALKNISGEELVLKREEYKQKINQYESIYVQAKQSFINEMTEILEKLLDVKIFFDHATANGGDEGRLEAGLIVANCKTNKLLADGLRTRFEKFIQDRGTNQIKKKIWFAILPAVQDKGISTGKKKVDIFKSVMAQENNDSINENEDYISFNTAKAMLELLNNSRIMTIFNFKANKNNGFGGIDTKYIIDKKEQTKGLNYAHAVLAYPNFTLTRERSISLGNEKIKVPGVYIDASYPAAGLLVASQQINYLEKHGFKGRVNKNNVCVRVNLEDDEIRKNFTTKFNRELALRWSKDIVDEINQDNFGFVFNSDQIYIDNEPVKNTYVYLARTLKKNKDGVYKPIYQILITDFVLQYLKTIGSKITPSNLDKFLNGEVKAWSREGSKYVNSILKTNEKIQKEEEDTEESNSKVNLKIKFVNDETLVEVNVGD